MRTRKQPPNCSRRTLPSPRSSTCLWTWTAACCVLADTTLFEGRFEEAAIWLRKALVLYRRLARQDSAVADFPNVVCCVARLGNPGDAARLTGAYNAMLSRHVPLEYSFTAENPIAHLQFLRRARLEQTVAHVREALGDDNFELLSRAGASSATTMPSTLRVASDPRRKQLGREDCFRDMSPMGSIVRGGVGGVARRVARKEPHCLRSCAPVLAGT